MTGLQRFGRCVLPFQIVFLSNCQAVMADLTTAYPPTHFQQVLMDEPLFLKQPSFPDVQSMMVLPLAQGQDVLSRLAEAQLHQVRSPQGRQAAGGGSSSTQRKGIWKAWQTVKSAVSQFWHCSLGQASSEGGGGGKQPEQGHNDSPVYCPKCHGPCRGRKDKNAPLLNGMLNNAFELDALESQKKEVLSFDQSDDKQPHQEVTFSIGDEEIRTPSPVNVNSPTAEPMYKEESEAAINLDVDILFLPGDLGVEEPLPDADMEVLAFLQSLGLTFQSDSLGEGTFCDVYLYHDENGSPVAVKLMKEDQLGRRIYRDRGEVFALSLPHHPDLLRIRCVLVIHPMTGDIRMLHRGELITDDIYDEYELAAVISDVAPGVELWKLLYRAKDFEADRRIVRSNRQLLSIAKRIVDLMVFLERNGCMYRDLKPENVMYDARNNRLTLVDLGFLKQLPGPFYRTDSFVGTPYSMSPEACAVRWDIDADYGVASDVWSLGAFILDLMTGFTPGHFSISRRRLYPINERDYVVNGSKSHLYKLIMYHSFVFGMQPDDKKTRIINRAVLLDNRERMHPEVMAILLGTLKLDENERMSLDDIQQRLSMLLEKLEREPDARSPVGHYYPNNPDIPSTSYSNNMRSSAF